MYKKYTDEELFYIYNEYVNNHKTTVQIAKFINRSQSGVEAALKRMGVDVSKISQEMKLRIPISEYENICDLYLKNYTTIEIGKIYNVTDVTIAKILRKNNISIRKAVKRSIIKYHNIFHIIDTPQKAYWLGWLITDGSVVQHHTRTNRSYIISFSLKISDRYIVERFAKFVGASEINVKNDKKEHPQSYFRFASQEMADDLAQYGVIPNKTGKQIFPTVKKELMPFLLRGIFEGNGSVYITKGILKTAFYGAESLIIDIAKLLETEDIYSMHTIINRGVISSYHISARNASYKLFKYMYNDISDETMICKRKYTIFSNYYE